MCIKETGCILTTLDLCSACSESFEADGLHPTEYWALIRLRRRRAEDAAYFTIFAMHLCVSALPLPDTVMLFVHCLGRSL